VTTSGIKNIIFDLGGVILNLSVQSTVDAFARLASISVKEIHDRLMQAPQFHDYEKGLLTDGEFRDLIRSALKLNATDAEIDRCWNAMLLDIPKSRLQLLEKLRKDYSLLLLSNTNEIHLTRFTDIVRESSGMSSLDSYFDVAYYSHRMKMRKPDREIFEYVLNRHALIPSETLFLDDNVGNLEGAQLTGIRTFHIQHPDQLFTLFS